MLIFTIPKGSYPRVSLPDPQGKHFQHGPVCMSVTPRCGRLNQRGRSGHLGSPTVVRSYMHTKDKQKETPAQEGPTAAGQHRD